MTTRILATVLAVALATGACAPRMSGEPASPNRARVLVTNESGSAVAVYANENRIGTVQPGSSQCLTIPFMQFTLSYRGHGKAGGVQTVTLHDDRHYEWRVRGVPADALRIDHAARCGR